MSQPSKSWCLTLNNYTQAEYDSILEWPVTYGVIGKEIAPATGTPHLQAYFTFLKAHRLTALNKLLPRGHWLIAKGSDIDNYIYCNKSKDSIVIGSKQAKAASSSLTDAITTIKSEGLTSLILTDPELYIRHHSGLERYAARLQTPRNFKPTVIWIYGPTGTGKTRYVYDNHPLNDIYTAPDDLKFWDGYENQPVTLFDDFRKDLTKFHTLLKILDRYTYQVNVKNSYRQFNSHTIYITTPYSPQETYNTREDIQQLIRRITEIKYMPSIKCHTSADHILPAHYPILDELTLLDDELQESDLSL